MKPSIQGAVLDAINARRSVRAYLDDPLDRQLVNRLLIAAVRAPTALYQQACAFAVVQDRALLQHVSDVAKPLFMHEMSRSAHGMHDLAAFVQPGFNIFYNAGTLIVICAPKAAPLAFADCWLGAENLMLMAAAMGLGTCVIGSAVGALNLPAVKSRLGIPDEYSAVAPIIAGYPSCVTSALPRKAPSILAWKTPAVAEVATADDPFDTGG